MSRKSKIELTELELDFITTARNYRRSYPNGFPQVYEYLVELFDKLTDPHS